MSAAENDIVYREYSGEHQLSPDQLRTCVCTMLLSAKRIGAVYGVQPWEVVQNGNYKARFIEDLTSFEGYGVPDAEQFYSQGISAVTTIVRNFQRRALQTFENDLLRHVWNNFSPRNPEKLQEHLNSYLAGVGRKLLAFQREMSLEEMTTERRGRNKDEGESSDTSTISVDTESTVPFEDVEFWESLPQGLREVGELLADGVHDPRQIAKELDHLHLSIEAVQEYIKIFHEVLREPWKLEEEGWWEERNISIAERFGSPSPDALEHAHDNVMTKKRRAVAQFHESVQGMSLPTIFAVIQKLPYKQRACILREILYFMPFEPKDIFKRNQHIYSYDDEVIVAFTMFLERITREQEMPRAFSMRQVVVDTITETHQLGYMESRISIPSEIRGVVAEIRTIIRTDPEVLTQIDPKYHGLIAQVIELMDSTDAAEERFSLNRLFPEPKDQRRVNSSLRRILYGLKRK